MFYASIEVPVTDFARHNFLHHGLENDRTGSLLYVLSEKEAGFITSSRLNDYLVRTHPLYSLEQGEETSIPTEILLIIDSLLPSYELDFKEHNMEHLYRIVQFCTRIAISSESVLSFYSSIVMIG